MKNSKTIVLFVVFFIIILGSIALMKLFLSEPEEEQSSRHEQSKQQPIQNKEPKDKLQKTISLFTDSFLNYDQTNSKDFMMKSLPYRTFNFRTDDERLDESRYPTIYQKVKEVKILELSVEGDRAYSIIEVKAENLITGSSPSLETFHLRLDLIEDKEAEEGEVSWKVEESFYHQGGYGCFEEDC